VRLGVHGTGDRFGPLAETWVLAGPLHDLVRLHDLDSPAALHRLLVAPSRLHADTVPDFGIAAIARAHEKDGSGLVESVLLACTDRRWGKVARPLALGVLERGLL
jgi:hypothetical protein